jgi:DNA-binding transcriptional MerR regulator
MAEDYKQLTLSNFRAEKDFYTVPEMAEIYKVSQSTIRMWIRKGYLKGEMHEPISRKAKTMRGRYRVYPHGLLDDIKIHYNELLELSMKKWPSMLGQLKKK